jgi:DNA polymerase III subunit alpha
MPEFTHLHVHSEYSLLDGLIRVPDLVRAAADAGFASLAITDHGAMYGAVRFYHEALEAGIRPIVGCELYVAPRGRADRDPARDRAAYHLTVLAESERGYRNLLELASRAQLEGFYNKPRVDRELLQQHADGLIVLSGCMSGEVPRRLLGHDEAGAREALAWYREVFRDRYYVELQDHDIEGLPEMNRELVSLARELDLPLVATNDVHFLRREDMEWHEVLLCLQTGKTITDPKRMRSGSTYYLRSAEEMAALFRDLPEAIANSMAIAERCDYRMRFGEYKLPVFEVPEGEDATSYLHRLCREGVARRYPSITDRVQDRLHHELGVIAKMGFEHYFLIVWDLCRYAQEQGIWWNVRGSGAGSIVAYALDITNIDPLAHDLFFERFLNPARISMPDIDLDLADDQRDRVIRYAFDKYGHDRVAQIITFGTMGARGAVRDAARVLDLPISMADRLARMIPAIAGKPCTIAQVLHPGGDEGDDFFRPEFAAAYRDDPDLRRVIDTARSLEGVARHASTHAAGVVIADRPIVEYAPLHRPTRDAVGGGALPLTQYAMDDVERLGLLKVDLLGLSTLTALRRAAELVERHHGRALCLADIPLDDPAIYELLRSGNVTGVFQVEGAGMRKMLHDMQPRRLEHVIAAVALYRPGPMQFIPDYIRRLHGEEVPEYLHPDLEPILAETFGIIIYQEQIIRIATDLAGYDAGEADTIRKAVGKKKEAELRQHAEAFVAGATARGIPVETARKVFSEIEKFARYGFNKAHAADYAMIVCQTAWFKAHYPIEYMTALLSIDQGDLGKVGHLVANCGEMGIPVLPPDVNLSDVDFTIEAIGGSEGAAGGSGAPRAIRFGLAAIKNVGESHVRALVESRGPEGFSLLDDLCRAVDLRALGRRGLESLIKAGALDAYGRRRGVLDLIDAMMAMSATHHDAAAAGQLSLFGDGPARPSVSLLPPVPKGEGNQRDELTAEKELVGAFLSDHPLRRVAEVLPQAVTLMIGDIDESTVGLPITIAGMVRQARFITTRNGAQMAFVELEDLHGTVEATVFPKVLAATRDLWDVDRLVIVRGTVESRNDRLQVVVAAAAAYEPEGAAAGAGPAGTGDGTRDAATRISGAYQVTVTIPRTGDARSDVDSLARLYRLLTSYHGSDRFSVVVPRLNGAVELEFPNATTRYCLALHRDLTDEVGPQAVSVAAVEV